MTKALKCFPETPVLEKINRVPVDQSFCRINRGPRKIGALEKGVGLEEGFPAVAGGSLHRGNQPKNMGPPTDHMKQKVFLPA
jgi:hypothetical protein